MDALLKQVITPQSFAELFSEWNRHPEAVLYAGGTSFGKQEKNILNLPPVLLYLDMIPELNQITRSEHYLEIGSMTKLNKLIRLGKVVPKVLRICLENIAGVQVRNIATIGGNICSVSLPVNSLEAPRLFDASAPLTALDAQYELRNANNVRWVSASRFHSTEEKTALGRQELLTRIRLPLHQWDYAVYKKLRSNKYINGDVLVFLAKTPKNILSDIRVVYKAGGILRNKNGENILNGKLLPLSRKTADDFIENWNEFLAKRHEISKFSENIIINSIWENIYNLSE